MAITNKNRVSFPAMRMKSFAINEVTSIEKKLNFCDRESIKLFEKDSGKQMSGELQTIVYEYLKNNCVELIGKIGQISVPKKPVEGKDLKDAEIEIQHFFNLKTKDNDPYSITFNMYHTKCSMLIQTYSSNTNICLKDGRFPAKAFIEDYLIGAIQLIQANVNIANETYALKSHLINYLQHQQQLPSNDHSLCQICHDRQPPDKSKALEIRECDQCGKRFHIQCLNKQIGNQRNKYRKNTKHLICLGCKPNEVENMNPSAISQENEVQIVEMTSTTVSFPPGFHNLSFQPSGPSIPALQSQ